MFYISGIESSLSNFFSSGLNQSINWDTITDEMEQKKRIKIFITNEIQNQKKSKNEKIKLSIISQEPTL